MYAKKVAEVKKEIRSVLLTYQEDVNLNEFLKTYRGLIGRSLPSKELGFPADVAFLQSMPDVVDLRIDSAGRYHLKGIADKSSEHIQKLVSKQRKNTKQKNARTKSRQPVHKLPDTSSKVRDLQPFLPGPLRAEILELMSNYNSSITLSSLALAYHRKYNKYLSLAKGLDTLEGLIKQIPELEIRNEMNERRVYKNSSFICTDKSGISSGEIYKSSPVQAEGKKNEGIEAKGFVVDESGVSEDVLKDFQMILQKCPDGILDIHFPPLYENVTGNIFDLHELGYNSIAELVDALPNMFKRIRCPDNNRQWLILPASSPIKNSPKDENLANHKRASPAQIKERIPADASSPVLQYLQPTLPDYLNLEEYVPVFISAVVNPNLFWFQLQTDEAVDKFEKFEEDMGHFYDNCRSNEYRMHGGDVAIGAACVVQCPADYQWYRAIIKAIPSPGLVNVLFVDYGSRENVPRDNVYYVWSKYHEFPACAFKAQLPGLKPAKNATSWPHQAQKKFVQLCTTAALMAYIKLLNKDTFSVYLCDTSGDEDVHFNDILVTEGYAEHCDQELLSPENTPSKETETSSIDNRISNIVSPKDDQSFVKSDDSGVNCEPALPVNRRLTFSPSRLNSASQSTSFSQDEQTSGRYIKMLEISEDVKIHFINFENQLYISCGELCRLLWHGKTSDFLIERLKNKDADITLHTLTKDDHVELFKQCTWSKISDFEGLNSSHSSLILCPLEEALKVLKMFGHPYICVSLVIQNEIKSFNPHDSFWKEFSYEELEDLESIDLEIRQKLNKLCLYDLKARHEALKIRRLKLLRVNGTSSIDELKSVENLQSFIESRIKHIETLYSCCS